MDGHGRADRPRVLIVDDEPLIREVLAMVFDDELDVQVDQAGDGIEALAAMQAHRPALVLLDVMMPRLDGCALCRRIKASPDWRAIPVVAFSAGRRRDDALRAGCDEFVAKPFELDDLLLIARRWLSGAARAPTAAQEAQPIA